MKSWWCGSEAQLEILDANGKAVHFGSVNTYNRHIGDSANMKAAKISRAPDYSHQMTFFANRDCKGYSAMDSVQDRTFGFGGVWERDHPLNLEDKKHAFSRGISSVMFSDNDTRLRMYNDTNFQGDN